jgi:hypothetical protein
MYQKHSIPYFCSQVAIALLLPEITGIPDRNSCQEQEFLLMKLDSLNQEFQESGIPIF